MQLLSAEKVNHENSIWSRLTDKIQLQALPTLLVEKSILWSTSRLWWSSRTANIWLICTKLACSSMHSILTHSICAAMWAHRRTLPGCWSCKISPKAGWLVAVHTCWRPKIGSHNLHQNLKSLLSFCTSHNKACGANLIVKSRNQSYQYQVREFLQSTLNHEGLPHTCTFSVIIPHLFRCFKAYVRLTSCISVIPENIRNAYSSIKNLSTCMTFVNISNLAQAMHAKQTSASATWILMSKASWRIYLYF